MPWIRFVAAALVVGSGVVSGGETYTQKPTVAEARARGVQEAGPTPEPKSDFAAGPVAQWIWHGTPKDNAKCVLKKSFSGRAKTASLIATCDNGLTIYLNGTKVASSNEWQTPVKVDVTKHVKAAGNELVVEATNDGGAAGFVLKLVLYAPDGSIRYVVSDDTWEAASDRKAENWTQAKVVGKMGDKPWGDVFAGQSSSGLPSTPRNVFNVPPGFQVELLYTVPKDKLGSWVSLTLDNKGRLLACDQDKKGLCRITPPAIGSDSETKVEHLDVKITSAQGMVYAFDSLYLSVNGGPGSGLYRVRDTDGDDQFDSVELLKSIKGGGEHGPHGIVLGPEGKSLYVVIGNHTQPPEKITPGGVPSNWQEDLLLPRQWDARGHARGILAPGGHICRVDPSGQSWEMVSIGYRNSYDIAFNADGELFAYDSDMEWDMGTPWYRPTRVTHATRGSEFGWRSGTGKWPTHYLDSLPPLVDVGPGSPVGVTFGYGTKFPAKYQRALYILDWTFGTMYAIHMEPNGASYKAVKEEFVSRTPLPLTDAVVGPDGALYFTVGGRGTQSELYRVTYTGSEAVAPVDAKNTAGAEARATRRQLEELQVPNADAKQLDFIWKHLGDADRFLRYTARVALEYQDPARWRDRMLAEKDPQTLLEAAVAYSRQGDKADQDKLLAALDGLDLAKLSIPQQRDLMRAYSLSFLRQGRPDTAVAARIAKRVDSLYPSADEPLNRELCNVLVYLDSPTVITKTLALMAKPVTPSASDLADLLARNPGYGGSIAKMLANQPELQNIHYAFALRNMRFGWTIEQRKAYYDWFPRALTKSGGASYEGFINNIRTEALANTSPAEKAALDAKVIAPPPKISELPKPAGPGREWSLADVVELAEKNLKGRNFEHGKRTFAAAQCVACHRFDGAGGATGQDLTNVAGRFQIRDLAESIIEPSKVISDQYQAHVIELKDGKIIAGRILGEGGGKLSILADPIDATKIVEVAKSEVDSITPSKVSLMPKDLLNVLNRDEVLDLIAYLMSRGNPDDPLFAK